MTIDKSILNISEHDKTGGVEIYTCEDKNEKSLEEDAPSNKYSGEINNDEKKSSMSDLQSKENTSSNQKKDEESTAVRCEEMSNEKLENASETSHSTSPRRRKQYAISTRWERDRNNELMLLEEEGKKPKFIQCTGSLKDLNSLFCFCANRIGGMFSLIEKKDGTPIVIAGPCWPFCVFITLPLILVVAFCVSYFIIFAGYDGTLKWLYYVYFPILVVTLGALFCVSCRDPGLVERVTDEEAGQNGWFWNEQVGSFRPSGAMYCRECMVLIQDYDHLCPWTGTGIGRGNMMAFRVFVVSVNLLCYLSIAIIAYYLIRGIKERDY